MMNQIRTPIVVDGMDFEIHWQDFGSYRRLNVFQNGKLLGTKNFPIRVGTETGIIEYAVKSILRGQDVKAELH